MTTIDAVGDARGDEVLSVVRERLSSASASDDEFRSRLVGRIYQENTDVTRFVLATLAEDSMTRETKVDLWRQEKNHFVWTIEHILPQGENLPQAWQEMLGSPEAAAQAQEEHRHRLGNLTITAYNSNLGNKSFVEKRDRQDSKGRFIGYRNGLSLNTELSSRDSWPADDIERRTSALADKVIERFPLA
nr:HNH endonuclease family protein [Brevibacterium daeguense]